MRFHFFILLPVLLLSVQECYGADRPNILWLVSEDTSTTLGCYGDSVARTPTLDGLAREGVLFERCFTQPVCAPSRFMLITGTPPASSGPAQHMRASGRIPDFVKGFPAYLRAAGYYTANNAKTDYNAPINLKDTWNANGKEAHYRNRAATNQPFFLVFNHEVCHESCLFPQKLRNTPAGFTPTDPGNVRVPPYLPDTPEMRMDLARQYDCQAIMDTQIAEKLADLRKAGLDEDTIIFYYGDNGGVVPRTKRSLQRTGTQVPLIVRFPPRWQHLAPAPPGSRLSNPVSFLDFAPTVLSLAGVEAPTHLTGRAFAGPKAATNQYVFCSRDRMDERYEMMRSVMDSRWLYIRNFRPDLPYVQPLQYPFQARSHQSWARVAREGKLTAATAQFWGSKPPEELYDLAADPDNIHNLAAEPGHTRTLDRMRGALKQRSVEIVDNGLVPEGSALEGYAASRTVGALPVGRVFDIACAASSRNPGCLPELMAALDDANEAIRWWGAQGCTVLGKAAHPAAEALQRRLKDDSGAVQVAAAEALARIGRVEAALPVLERWLQQTDTLEFALQAGNVLDRLGDSARPSLPMMRRVLAGLPEGDGEPRMRGYLRRILEHSCGVLEGRIQPLVYPDLPAAKR